MLTNKNFIPDLFYDCDCQFYDLLESEDNILKNFQNFSENKLTFLKTLFLNFISNGKYPPNSFEEFYNLCELFQQKNPDFYEKTFQTLNRNSNCLKKNTSFKKEKIEFLNNFTLKLLDEKIYSLNASSQEEIFLFVENLIEKISLHVDFIQWRNESINYSVENYYSKNIDWQNTKEQEKEIEQKIKKETSFNDSGKEIIINLQKKLFEIDPSKLQKEAQGSIYQNINKITTLLSEM